MLKSSGFWEYGLLLSFSVDNQKPDLTNNFCGPKPLTDSREKSHEPVALDSSQFTSFRDGDVKTPLCPLGKGPKGIGHQTLAQRHVLIPQFSFYSLQDRALGQWSLNFDVQQNHLGSLLKMQITAPPLEMLIHEICDQVILRQVVLMAHLDKTLSLGRTSGWIPCECEPKGKCEKTLLPPQPELCSPQLGHRLGYEERVFLPMDISFWFVAYKINSAS